MSIFDSIANTVGSLFEGDSDIYEGIRSGVKFLNDNNTAQEKRANDSQALLGFLQRNASMQDVDQEGKYKPHSTDKFGTGNYSTDYKQIQAEWSAYLRGVADYTPIVPGEKYSKGAI